MSRQIKGIVFDVDGTLIEEISWQKLNLALGVSLELDQRLFKEYHEHRFTYQEWIDQIVAVYHANGPVHRDRIEQILTQYTLAQSARTVSLALQARPYHVGIVSGGLDVVVRKVAEDICVKPEYASSNSVIHYDNEGYLSTVVARGHDHEVKLEDFLRLCETWGIQPEECVCVGDGNPDRPLFEACGNGVTFDYQRCSMLHGTCWRQISKISDLLSFL
jgi:HAD superfamily phosphoserine phosphatase-like hydrolase